jgi:hypothetical protein
MYNFQFRHLLIIVLAFVIVSLQAGCIEATPSSHTSSTSNLSTTQDARIPPSVTPTQPTLAPTYLTPNPTVTPLLGGGRTITFQDYNQTLILEIGATFIIQKLPGKSDIEIQDPGIIQLVSGPADPTQGDQEYQAISSGETSLNIVIIYPCPTSEIPNPGCIPFPHFLHIIVLGESTPTSNPHTVTPYPQPATPYP